MGTTSVGEPVPRPGPTIEPPAFNPRPVVNAIFDRWSRGESPSTATAVAEFPQLRAFHNELLDLLYEEYCLRRSAGQSIDIDRLCADFPAEAPSLHSIVETEAYLCANANVLAPVLGPVAGGQWLGFHLVRPLGAGARSEVFLATDPALGGRFVVLKIARDGAAEAQRLGRLSHPNIVTVYSVQNSAAAGLATICMEYRGAATLAHALDWIHRQGRLPLRAAFFRERGRDGSAPEIPVPSPPQAASLCGSYVDGVLQLGVQLADALAYLHAQGISHGDLKPSNILLSPEGIPLLLDYNQAVDQTDVASGGGGTIPYMAPEQVGAYGRQRLTFTAACQADLYGLGAVLFELLTGRLPFAPRSCQQLTDLVRADLLEQQQQGPPSVRAFNPAVDRSSAALVERCLAFQPWDRPESAAAIARALRQQLSAPRRGRRWIAARPQVAWRAGLTGLGLSALLLTAQVLQPPWAERVIARAAAAYEKGQYAAVVKQMNELLESDSSIAEAYFLRGRANQKLAKPLAASEDFQAACSLKETGRTQVAWAYVLQRSPTNHLAIAHYDRAIELGFGNAAVYNNRGRACMLKGLCKQARTDLKRAITLDPQLGIAYHNLLQLDWSEAWQGGDSIPPGWEQHLQMALTANPTSGRIALDGARAFIMAARDNDAYGTMALEMLRQAIANGLDPAVIKRDPVFKELAGDGRFEAILAQAPRGTLAPDPPGVLDPLEYGQP